MKLRIGVNDWRSSKKHSDVIDLVRLTPRGDVRNVHLACGRGFGKSTLGVFIAGLSLFKWMPNLPGLVTEPTHRHLHTVWLREWAKCWPRELWDVKVSPFQIVSKIGTGTIDLVSRNVDNPGKEMSKGPNYAWGIDDEAAYKFRRQTWVDEHAAIRHPDAPFRYHLTLTTPKLNEYHDLVSQDGHYLIQASTYDNPFLPAGFAEELERSCDPQYAEQEIHGRFIALSGRIWRNFVDQLAPAGNRYPGKHVDGRPWELWCDIGIRSAWLAVQKYHDGRSMKYVVTHEWQPNNEGAEQTIQRIKGVLGTPMRVIVGSDVSTRSVVDASTVMTYFRRTWGDSIQVNPVRGRVADKGLQHMTASAAILNTKGERRFFVAEHLVSHDHDNGRGILDVMRKDVWLETPRVGEFLPKTKGRPGMADTEDTRDAMLYGLIVNEAPAVAMTNSHAA